MKTIRVIYAVLTLQLVLVSCTKSPSLPQPRNDGADRKSAWSNIVPENHMRQTFVSAKKSVRSIEVAVLPANPTTPPTSDSLTLTLLDELGQPLSSVSRIVPGGYDGWLEFVFPHEVKVNVGQKLMFELADTGRVIFGWKYSQDHYSGGERVCFKDKPDKLTDWLFRVN
jgi:hypothetical protein